MSAFKPCLLIAVSGAGYQVSDRPIIAHRVGSFLDACLPGQGSASRNQSQDLVVLERDGSGPGWWHYWFRRDDRRLSAWARVATPGISAVPPVIGPCTAGSAITRPSMMIASWS